MIMFLGAPTLNDVLKTWKSHSPPQYEETPSLRPFKIDPSQKTTGVAWRRLVDPVESLSQELAETTMQSRVPEDLFLERSLQIFTDECDDDDNDGEMDLCNPADYSELSVSQIYTPFLTGYDFDVNEITELEDLPEAKTVNSTPQRKYSIIVAILEISPCQQITTKYGKSVSLVKLILADQTNPHLEIACWEHMAVLARNLRTNDIVYFRGIDPFCIDS
jgi:hypothetical protein